MRRAFLALAVVTSACGSPTSPDPNLAGTWAESFSFPGESLVMNLDSAGNGRGTYAIEAGKGRRQRKGLLAPVLDSDFLCQRLFAANRGVTRSDRHVTVGSWAALRSMTGSHERRMGRQSLNVNPFVCSVRLMVSGPSVTSGLRGYTQPQDSVACRSALSRSLYFRLHWREESCSVREKSANCGEFFDAEGWPSGRWRWCRPGQIGAASSLGANRPPTIFCVARVSTDDVLET
jgi:hypothetical protein